MVKVDAVYDTLFVHTGLQLIFVSVADLGNPSDEKTAALMLKSFKVRLLSNVSRLVIVKLPAVPAVVRVSWLPVANVRAEPTSACTATLMDVDV